MMKNEYIEFGEVFDLGSLRAKIMNPFSSTSKDNCPIQFAVECKKKSKPKTVKMNGIEPFAMVKFNGIKCTFNDNEEYTALDEETQDEIVEALASHPKIKLIMERWMEIEIYRIQNFIEQNQEKILELNNQIELKEDENVRYKYLLSAIRSRLV